MSEIKIVQMKNIRMTKKLKENFLMKFTALMKVILKEI